MVLKLNGFNEINVSQTNKNVECKKVLFSMYMHWGELRIAN